MAGIEIVRSVEDQVVVRKQCRRLGPGEPPVVGPHRDMGVEGLHRRLGGKHLGLADPRIGMDHLPLEVGEGDGVVVDHPDRAHAGGGEVEERGRAESPPAPTTRTFASFSRRWPMPPTSRSTMWRA